MRRLFTLTLLSIAALALSARPALAWTNFRFNVGLNLAWQGAGNCYFFGLFRSGPAPAPWTVGCSTAGYPYYPYYAPYTPPYYDPNCLVGRASTTTPAATAAPPTAPASATRPAVTPTSSVFRPVGYFPNQAPSYWYHN
jgi:hypothetical protein